MHPFETVIDYKPCVAVVAEELLLRTRSIVTHPFLRDIVRATVVTDGSSQSSCDDMGTIVFKDDVFLTLSGIDNMDSYTMQMSMYMSTRLQPTDYIETLSNVLKPHVPSMPYE